MGKLFWSRRGPAYSKKKKKKMVEIITKNAIHYGFILVK